MYIIHIPCTVQEIQTYDIESIFLNHAVDIKKGKVHPCTGTEVLYRPYGPYGE